MRRLLPLLLVAFTAPVVAAPEAAMPLSDLAHIHGIEIDPSDGTILLATHFGLYRYESGQPAILVSSDRNDYMGFVLTDTGLAIASGHPENGGNLGVIGSSDLGATWTTLSPGADGPVDFHAIADAAGDPEKLFGLYGGAIQESNDAGRTWRWSGDAPGQTIDLGASADGRLLYAATANGVRISADAGETWEPISGDLSAPTTAIAVFGPEVLAYAVGHGLVARTGDARTWTVRASDMGDDVILHMAQDAKNPLRLVAVTQKSSVLESTDGGSTWRRLD